MVDVFKVSEAEHACYLDLATRTLRSSAVVPEDRPGSDPTVVTP